MLQNFKKKVEKGEAKIYWNRNIQGSGYKFNETEDQFQQKQKHDLKKRYNLETGISDPDSDSDDIMDKKRNQASQGSNNVKSV